MLPLIVAISVFLGVLVLAVLVGAIRLSLAEASRQELARRVGPSVTGPSLLSSQQPDWLARALGPLGAWMHGLRAKAGLGGSAVAVAGSALLSAGGCLAVLTLVLDGPLIAVGLLGALLPVFVLSRVAATRSRRVTEQIPDALDLVARALRAGHSFPDALHVASTEVAAPLGEELGQAAEQHRLGLELRPCLEGLVERVPDSFELRLLVSAVLLNRETGGNLIETLDNLAETVRERIVFEGKVQALTAEVRASAAILTAMPFLAAFGLTAVEPAYLLPLLQPGLGRAMLLGGLASLTLGMVLMRRLSQVEL